MTPFSTLSSRLTRLVVLSWRSITKSPERTSGTQTTFSGCRRSAAWPHDHRAFIEPTSASPVFRRTSVALSLPPFSRTHCAVAQDTTCWAIAEATVAIPSPPQRTRTNSPLVSTAFTPGRSTTRTRQSSNAEHSSSSRISGSSASRIWEVRRSGSTQKS